MTSSPHSRFRLFSFILLGILLGLLTTPTSTAQALGGLLKQAQQKVNQSTSGTGRTANTPPPATSLADDPTGPIPESPDPADLTVDNNMAFARIVLANHRPWAKGEHVGDDDYFYRYLRDEYKAPLQFTFDRAYVDYITPRHYYLWSVIENISENLFSFYDPAKDNTANRYFRQKLLKIKQIHLTTTPQRAQPNHYAGSAGYVMSFDAVTGILTAAISNAPGNQGISRINQEDIQAFIQENVR